MHTADVTLKKILADFFDIPVYQRLYSWDIDNWYTLYESFLNNYESNMHYFLGSLIIKKTDKQNTFNVIDGQQRLTTVCIFLKAMSDILLDTHVKIKDDKNDAFYYHIKKINDILKSEPKFRVYQYRISHNKVDKKNFECVMAAKNYEEIINEYKDKEAKPKMVKAYQFFYNILQGKEYNEKLKEYLENDEIKKFQPDEIIKLYEYILDKCILITITLDEKESEQNIFNTMNSTGLKLSTGDLLKNYFFNNPDKLKEEEDLETWQRIFETGENIFDGDEKISFWSEVVSRGNTNLDLIMYCAILIKETGETTFNTFNQKTNYQDLFNVYTKMLNKGDDIQETLTNIFNLAEKYLSFESLDTDNIDFKNGLNILLFVIDKSGYNVLYPLVLFLALQNIDKDDKHRVYFALAKLVTFNCILSIETNYLNKLVSKLLHIFQISGLEKMLEEIKKNFNDRISDDDKLVEKVENIIFKKRSQKSKIILFLALVESYKRGKHTEQLFKYDSNLQSIEHIIPQKYQKNYNIETEDNIYLIGNLTLLNKSLNSKASNKKFEEKKYIYSESILKIVSNLADEPSVSESFIKKRSKEFAEVLINIFK